VGLGIGPDPGVSVSITILFSLDAQLHRPGKPRRREASNTH
jgi:Flp pilus assembly protein TadB